MSSILDRIIVDKQLEVALRKQLIPIKQLEQSVLFERQSLSLCERLKQSASGLITEHKRRSPSKDCINQNLNIQDVAKGYEKAGACGMSVLTDMRYFGPVTVADLKCGRLMIQAAISHMLLLNIGNTRIHSELISMEMATQV